MRLSISILHNLATALMVSIAFSACAAPLSGSAAPRANLENKYVALDTGTLVPNRALLFVSYFNGPRTIDILDGAYKRVRTISLGGSGATSQLATDVSGYLYVATLDSHEVEVFSPPNYDSHRSIRLPAGDDIFGMAVDEITGVLAILECQCGGTGSKSAIYFYRQGSNTPCNVLSVPTVPSSSVFDKEGTLFVHLAGASGQDPYVASVSGECSASSLSALSFKLPIYPTGTFAVTKDDNIVIQSWGSPDNKGNAKSPWPMYTYSHPTNGVFGDPIATTVFDQYGNNKYEPEQAYALATDGNAVWAQSSPQGGLRLFAYPKGGPSQHVLPKEYGEVAVFPPLVP